MTSTPRVAVGFIGLGDQGLPMAIAIAEAGFPLHAWARRPTSLEALAGSPTSVTTISRDSQPTATSSACA